MTLTTRSNINALRSASTLLSVLHIGPAPLAPASYARFATKPADWI